MAHRLEPTFDPGGLELRGVRRIFAALLGRPSPGAYALARRWLPIAILPAYPRWWQLWVLVTRRDDVQEILSNDRVFEVPWTSLMRELTHGNTHEAGFILGLDRSSQASAREYGHSLRDVMVLFRLDDVRETVAPRAARLAAELVAQAAAQAPPCRLEVIHHLLAPIFIDTCQSYYGLPAPKDSRALLQWTIALSGMLFGPPFDWERVKSNTMAAGELLRGWLDDAIADRIQQAAAGKPLGDTVLDRMAIMHRAGQASMPPDAMRAILTGMVVGSVPTNLTAAGHILEVLLDRPEAMRAARAAAASGDDALLSRCLFEAMRFEALNPGPWRRCNSDYLLARGTARQRRIRKNTLVLASTASAMLDPEGVGEPLRFNPARDAADAQHFGHGLHWCAGRFIADAQITQSFKALLLQGGLRRAPGKPGQTRLLGLFPWELTVEFERGTP